MTRNKYIDYDKAHATMLDLIDVLDIDARQCLDYDVDSHREDCVIESDDIN